LHVLIPRGILTADRARFLAEVIANPDDDAPRLIFADWIEDNGDPERATCSRAPIDWAGYQPEKIFPVTV
jgi:uncharacterized protein (TIGR02996 family)